MNTKAKGVITEQAVTLALLKRGYVVLRPLGENSRYDLAFESAGVFYRVQCKTGRLRKGAVCFATCSVRINTRGRVTRCYEGIDFFGVYCREEDRVYLVPVAEVGGRQASLRVHVARNGQRKGVRRADDYEIRTVEPGGIEPPTFRLQTERSPS